MQNDLMPRIITEETPVYDKEDSLAALRTHAQAMDVKDKVDSSTFSVVKGKVMAKIMKELKIANERRLSIAEKAGSLEGILGGSDES